MGVMRWRWDPAGGQIGIWDCHAHDAVAVLVADVAIVHPRPWTRQERPRRSDIWKLTTPKPPTTTSCNIGNAG